MHHGSHLLEQDRVLMSTRAGFTVQSRRPVYGILRTTLPIANFLDESTIQVHRGAKADSASRATLAISPRFLRSTRTLCWATTTRHFFPLGGSPFFAKANRLYRMHRTPRKKDGREPTRDQRNRYWLVDNMVNDKYRESMRRCQTTYHRRGEQNVWRTNRRQ